MTRRLAWWGFVGGLVAISTCTTDAQQVTLASTDAASAASTSTPSSTTPSSTTPSTTTPSTTTTDTRPRHARTAEQAIGDWLADHRDEAFAGNRDPYRGACPESSTTYGFLCSSPVEQVGELAIHSVGVYGTDWGGDLLLRRDDSGWMVVDGEGWPEPELALGPPWSR